MLALKIPRRLFESKAFRSRIFVFLSLFAIASFFVFLPSAALAQEQDFGLNEASRIGLGSASPGVVVARVVQAALGFLGLIAVVLVIYAGFVMMTSDGNAEKVDKAKKILKNAVIGLIIILSAFAIVSFILNKLTGSIWGNGGGGGGGGGGGLGALGNGIIKSVYPEPGQKNVVKNTVIVVTFREKMKADTICDQVDANGNCAPGAMIKKENIRIFETERGDSCQVAKENNENLAGIVNTAQAAVNNCEATNIIDVYCASKDNETFVFMPKKYLNPASASDPDNNWHTVMLSRDIKKADSSAAFGSLTTGFSWSFEVTNRLDLTPPQVLKDGVFPTPDNEADIKNPASSAIRAKGSIKVLQIPRIYSAASAGNPVKNPANATWSEALLEGSYSCFEDGMISVSLDNELTASVAGVSGVVPGDSAGDNKISLGCGLDLVPKTGNFSAGNAWKIAVSAEKPADTLRVGGADYSFSSQSGEGKIKIGSDADATAANLASALSGNSVVLAAVSETDSKIVDISAKNAGEGGNNIEMQSSSQSALEIKSMEGGKDEEVTITVKGRRDKARNAIIQINFNEAVNPMSVSGTAGEVRDAIKVVNTKTGSLAAGASCAEDSDCLSYSCKNGACKDDYFDGKFLISNQYATVEFISNIECGVNACGEKVYCLPENSHLAVKLKAASLAGCTADGCLNKESYTLCEDNVCKDQNGKKYPLSEIPLIGIADMALNSFDGNRNNYADGPESQSNEPPFDENHDVAGSTHGDDFIWSFFINDKIDLTPPEISLTKPIHDGRTDSDPAVEIDFSKLMMSSSLTTGERKITRETAGSGNATTTKEIIHKLINIYPYAAEPIGYWITKTNIDDDPVAGNGIIGDGEADWTKAYLNHSSFADQEKYRVQAGSGVKDIYQNCYKPCSSGSCAGAPSCCGDVPKADELCE
ncbi:MAG: pilin [Patescibacteria group bacterium]|jgi:hypothetical protein